jgi:hypothetical protein
MKRESLTNIVVFCLLVALGVASRWMSDAYKPDLSNFTAIGATALFAGYFFKNRLAAILVPLAVMVVSNLCLKPYNNFGQFAIVFIALLLPVAIGMLLRRKLNVWTVIGGSLASSVLFYLITNFPDWYFYNNMYPHTPAGLVGSYVAAIPFFSKTLAGDLFFTAVIFGVYWAAVATRVLMPRYDVPQTVAK